MASLSKNLFCNIDRYPHFNVENDQWYQSGWVYDVETDKYIQYHISRREQYDKVRESLSYGEFKSRILPKASIELRTWFLSFAVFRYNDVVWIVQDDVLYTYVGFKDDSFGRPEIIKHQLNKKDAPQAVQSWLNTL